MKKKYKLNKKGKEFISYGLVIIINLIFILFAPDILKEVNNINDYRFNSLVYSLIFITNVIALVKINGGK